MENGENMVKIYGKKKKLEGLIVRGSLRSLKLGGFLGSYVRICSTHVEKKRTTERERSNRRPSFHQLSPVARQQL